MSLLFSSAMKTKVRLWMVTASSAQVPTVCRYERELSVYPQWMWSDSEKLTFFGKPMRLELFVIAAKPTHPDCYRDTNFLSS